MEGVTKEVNHSILASRIGTELKSMLQYKSFFYEVQKMAASDPVKLSNFRESLLQQVKFGSLNYKLQNMVFHWLRERCIGFKLSANEPLDYMKKYQETWEAKLWKSLVSISHETKTPLARGRLNSEQEMIQENWSEFSQWDIDLSRFKPVYSPKDFLDRILQISCPNYILQGSEKLWSSLPAIPIKVKTFREMKTLLAELTTGEPHLGLIQILDLEGELLENSNFQKIIQSQRLKLGDLVLSQGDTAVSQEFLKKGSALSHRGKLWQIILGSHVTNEHVQYYNQLKQAVLKSDLLIDRITLKDVQLTAANDDQYFVFEDSLYQALLCFSRDLSLLDLFDRCNKNPLKAIVKGKSAGIRNGEGLPVVYPPNGIIPFHGFTMYGTMINMARLYLNSIKMMSITLEFIMKYYHEKFQLPFIHPLYSISKQKMRALYCRYFFRLHEISSHENGIIALCLLFEKLLHRHEPQLWFHLKALHVLPVRVVFKWLMKGFSGYLPAEQVLQLWDLMLAYNSVQILSLLAVGVLSVRKDNLMKAQQPQTVDAVLADLSSITVLPVLQLALMKELLF